MVLLLPIQSSNIRKSKLVVKDRWEPFGLEADSVCINSIKLSCPQISITTNIIVLSTIIAHNLLKKIELARDRAFTASGTVD